MPNLVKPILNLPKDVGEAVGKPVLNEVSNVIDESVNAVFGYPTQAQQKNPQADTQRKADEERKRQNILRYFEALKANASGYKQQQDFQKQQRKQDEVAEQQKVKQFEIQKQQKKQEAVEVFRAQRKAEIKVKGG